MPPAKLPTQDPDVFEYGLVTPVFMPESRLDDQLVIVQKVDAGTVQELRRPLDKAYVALCQYGTIEVIAITCDRVAATGGRIEGNDVVVEVSPIGFSVTRTVVRLSGVAKNRTQRYRTPSDEELLYIERMEASPDDLPSDFNY
jgi:hypothetical protein